MSTPYTTLITVEQLQALQARHAPLMVFDCSFELMNPDAADRLYAEAHIAGAVQAHLDRNLSAPSAAEAVNGGRHPLPRRELFAARRQLADPTRYAETIARSKYKTGLSGLSAKQVWTIIFDLRRSVWARKKKAAGTASGQREPMEPAPF